MLRWTEIMLNINYYKPLYMLLFIFKKSICTNFLITNTILIQCVTLELRRVVFYWIVYGRAHNSQLEL